jgi:putative membrane protein
MLHVEVNMTEVAPGWQTWSTNPGVIVAVAVAAVAYIACYRRAHRRTERAYIGHVLAFAAGLLVVVGALLSPLDSIGDSWLLSAHMLQHVLLADIAPALLVLGVGPPLLAHGLSPGLLRALSPRARLGRLLRGRWLGPVSLGLWAATQWCWSIPSVFDTATAHPLLHAAEHLSLLGSGLLLWTVVIDPLPGQARRAVWSRLGYLGASRAAAAVVCLPLTWLDTTLYSRYADAPRAYGISALTDQRVAGAGMCLIEFLVFGIAFIVVFLDLLGREERGTRLLERAARGVPDSSERGALHSQ